MDTDCGAWPKVRWVESKIWAEGRTWEVSVSEGWHTYTIDLSTAAPMKGAAWPGVQWNVLQIMLHESHYAWTSHIDWAMLTADNTAADSYTVQWNMSGSGGAPTITIFWATGQSSVAVIGSGYVVPASPTPTTPLPKRLYLPLAMKNYSSSLPTAQYQHTIGVDGLTSGQSYYVALKVQDGGTTQWFFSQLPVKKL